MRQFLVRFIRPESFVHTQSSAGFTIATSEFKFFGTHNSLKGSFGRLCCNGVALFLLTFRRRRRDSCRYSWRAGLRHVIDARRNRNIAAAQRVDQITLRSFSDWQTLHGVSDPIDRRRWRKIWSLCKRWRREQHQRKSYFSHFNLLRQGHYNTVLPYCILLTNPLGLLCYRKSPYRADNSVNSFAGLTPRPFILFPA